MNKIKIITKLVKTKTVDKHSWISLSEKNHNLIDGFFVVYTKYKGMVNFPKIPEKKRNNKEPNGSLIGKRAVRPSQISYCKVYQLNY